MARVSFNCMVLLVLLIIDISLGQGVDEASQRVDIGHGCPPAMDRRICECGAAFSPFRAHSPPLPRDRKPAAGAPEHSER